ncbi:MAG: PIN domain-containing protein [Gemmataceae bacterium]|nr:PIN domain-containing protein [Gemmataceae bacterium]
MFADTSGWANFADRREPFHDRAVELVAAARAAKAKIVTTNYVLAELPALLTRPMRLAKRSQVALLDTLRTARWVEVVHIDVELDAAAWDLWEARPDKEWSLTDCASFLVMERRGLVEALTSDHHFEQAGFVRLLR